MPGKIDNIEVKTLQFAKLSEKGFPPKRGSEGAVGFDLYSAYDYVIKAGARELVRTDIQVAIPEGCYGRVAPRSGLAVKHGIDVGAGVVDPDYRGNLCVVMFNFGTEEFVIKPGDRIAQLICEKVLVPDLVERATLDQTERGEGGFGSTGIN